MTVYGSVTENQVSSLFLARLPPELRVKIYLYALGDHIRVYEPPAIYKQPACGSAVLGCKRDAHARLTVCRLIYLEAHFLLENILLHQLFELGLHLATEAYRY